MTDQPARPDALSAEEPMFYQAAEALSPDAHGALGLSARRSYGFASRANAVPLMAAEFPQACRSYPIVFSGPARTPIAVTGLREGENLFVDTLGRWAGGHYVPAYVRRYPFTFAEDPSAATLTLCVDRASDALVPLPDDSAAPLFAAGAPSQATKDALSFCQAYQRLHAETVAFVELLTDLGLLADQLVTLDAEEADKMTGFKGIDEARFAALPDDVALQLRRAGAMAAIHAQLASSHCWQALLLRRS